MISKEPKEMKVAEIQNFLLGGVAPRPIALVSTISPDGIPNLAPFSFFNAFGANPPMIAFSASRRVRDNTTKHTLTNIEATGECVVQAVTYDMVQQVSLASMEYPSDIDEFGNCRYQFIGLNNAMNPVQTGIRDCYDTNVRIDGTERIVGRFRRSGSQCREDC